VNVAISDNEKDSFIVVAAVTAPRIKLLLCPIANGRTSFVENAHFSDIGYHANHSQSGWQTAETFTCWLNWPRQVDDDAESI
jgi:hypothetical protein